MTIAALDSAYPPNNAQIAAARAAGYAGWNGYFASQHILNGWSDADFQRVRAGGLQTLAFCSGWADPTAMKIRGERLGIPIVLDCEGGIRGDGPWLQPWLSVAGAGLYANYWVFAGKHAPRYMLCAYPTSGDPGNVSWSSAYGPRPAGLCGWQWAGSHNFAGVTVDSEWLDDGFYGNTQEVDLTPDEHNVLFRLSAHTFGSTDPALAPYAAVGKAERDNQLAILKAVTTVGTGGTLDAATVAELKTLAANAQATRAEVERLIQEFHTP